jgi:Ca2+-binding EF-hand superfamily protein
MPIASLMIPLLLMTGQASVAPINVVGHAWAPFISPMGEPFRARTKADNTLELWFRQADKNGDGVLTPDEMVADADRFFAKLDLDHNGEIEPEELVAYEWDVAPEIQVNSRMKRSPSQPPEQLRASDSDDDQNGEAHHRPGKGRRGDLQMDDGLQGGARYSLLNIPEPVADADADFNRVVTRSEFRQAALARFQLLDRNRQGSLTLAQLQAMVPALPKDGRRPKRNDHSPDARIGQPLPPGNLRSTP